MMMMSLVMIMIIAVTKRINTKTIMAVYTMARTKAANGSDYDNNSKYSDDS